MKSYTYVAVFLPLLSGCSASEPQSSYSFSPPQRIAFECPRDGTRTRFAGQSGTSTTIWSGTDPADPGTCLFKGREGTGRSLYQIHALPMREGEADAREAWAQAFAGSGTERCYRVAENALGSSSGMSNLNLYNHCVSQLGSTTINIGGSARQVVAFRYTDEGTGGNYFAANWTYFYDPVARIFVKGEPRNIRGNPASPWVRTVVKQATQ